MKLIATATFVILAGQASALDCSFGDAAMAYTQAQSEGANVRAVVGRLKWLDGSDGPRMEFEGQAFELAARFTGEIMQPNNARVPVDQDIVVITLCINGDCGYADGGYDMLSFLHDVDGKTVMYAYPCQSYPMADDADQLALVQACIDGDTCDGAWVQ